MNFLIPSRLQPSVSLYEEYEQSEANKMLNTLQSLEFYNERFKKGWEEIGLIFSEDRQMSEEVYDRLKERYESRPPFVFFFNLTIEPEIVTDLSGFYVGYVVERDGVMVSIDYKA